MKGGIALDLRMGDRARTTKDIDLESASDEETIVEIVTDASAIDFDDFFHLLVERVRPIVKEDVTRALRFRVIGQLDGRRFETVTLDVGLTRVVPELVETIQGSKLLQFAGIPLIHIPVVSLQQHLAEKLHAYCDRYGGDRQSSRVKDLVDVVLIVTEFRLASRDVKHQIQTTFAGRYASQIPSRLPAPPAFWRASYRVLAGEIGLDPDIDLGYKIAAAFFDPVLSGEIGVDSEWSPEHLRWS